MRVFSSLLRGVGVVGQWRVVAARPVHFMSLNPNRPSLVALGKLGTLRKTSYVFYPTAVARSNGSSSQTLSVLGALKFSSAMRYFQLPVSGSEALTLESCRTMCRDDGVLHTRKRGIMVITRKSTNLCSSVRCVCSGLRRSSVPIRRVTNVPTFVTSKTVTNLRVIDRRRQLVIVPNRIATGRLSSCLGRRAMIIVVGLSRYVSRMRRYVVGRPRCRCRCFRGMKARGRCCSYSARRLRRGECPCFSMVVVEFKWNCASLGSPAGRMPTVRPNACRLCGSCVADYAAHHMPIMRLICSCVK